MREREVMTHLFPQAVTLKPAIPQHFVFPPPHTHLKQMLFRSNAAEGDGRKKEEKHQEKVKKQEVEELKRKDTQKNIRSIKKEGEEEKQDEEKVEEKVKLKKDEE